MRLVVPEAGLTKCVRGQNKLCAEDRGEAAGGRHPKFDPVTKDMVTMGYEAKGDGTPDVCYYVVDAKGKITQTVWLVAPFPGMIHDFAFTDNWVSLECTPVKTDLKLK